MVKMNNTTRFSESVADSLRERVIFRGLPIRLSQPLVNEIRRGELEAARQAKRKLPVAPSVDLSAEDVPGEYYVKLPDDPRERERVLLGVRPIALPEDIVERFLQVPTVRVERPWLQQVAADSIGMKLDERFRIEVADPVEMLRFLENYGPLTPSFVQPIEVREHMVTGPRAERPQAEPATALETLERVLRRDRGGSVGGLDWSSRWKSQVEENEWQYLFSTPLTRARAIWEEADKDKENALLATLDLFHASPAGSLLYFITLRSLEHLLADRILKPCVGCSRWFHTREPSRSQVKDRRKPRKPRRDAKFHNEHCEHRYRERQRRQRVKAASKKEESDGT